MLKKRVDDQEEYAKECTKSRRKEREVEVELSECVSRET